MLKVLYSGRCLVGKGSRGLGLRFHRSLGLGFH